MKRINRLSAAVILLLLAGVLFWTSVFFLGTEEHDVERTDDTEYGGADLSHIANWMWPENDGRSLICATQIDEEYQNMLELRLLRHRGAIPSDAQEAKKKLSGSVVQIVSGNLLGSGVVIEMTDEEVILASVKHLLGESGTVQVTFGFSDGTQMTAEGTVLGLSESYDLGYASVPVSAIGYDFVTKLRYHALESDNFDSLRAGDGVIQVGSTDGPAEDVYCGTVENKWVFVGEFGSFMIFNDCMAKPGMSGGGAFNDSGELIGIITGGDDTATVCMPVNLVLEEYSKLR